MYACEQPEGWQHGDDGEGEQRHALQSSHSSASSVGHVVPQFGHSWNVAVLRISAACERLSLAARLRGDDSTSPNSRNGSYFSVIALLLFCCVGYQPTNTIIAHLSSLVKSLVFVVLLSVCV